MPHSGAFPSKDAEFNDYFQRVNPYLNTNKTRLLVAAGDLTALTALFTQWNTTYPLSKNPDTRTVAITKTKVNIRKQIETLLKKIYGDIPKSILTTDDRAVLNLKARDPKPSPAPEPVSTPLVELQPGNGRQVIIRYSQEGGEKGSSHRTAKPTKISRMEIFYKIGDPAPTNPEECNRIVEMGKSPYALNLNTTDAGKRLYGFARWMNTRNQPGPWTALLSVIVP